LTSRLLLTGGLFCATWLLEGGIAVMAALLFTCPITRMRVQHWLDDDEDASEDDYEGVTCQACAGMHFVNRKGKVLGGDDE
jgi:hypothetical protein